MVFFSGDYLGHNLLFEQRKGRSGPLGAFSTLGGHFVASSGLFPPRGKFCGFCEKPLISVSLLKSLEGKG